MAPRIQDTDYTICASCSDQAFLFAPLHKSSATTTTTATSTRSATSATAQLLNRRNNNRNNRNRKNVSFGAMVNVQHVMSLGDYTPKELEASWFDRDTLRSIRETARFETRLFDSGILFEDRTHNGYKSTVRGLRTRAGILRKRAYRWNALAAVFSEMDAQVEELLRGESIHGANGQQQRQQQQQQHDLYSYGLFNFDDESIADAYFVHTDPCALEAEAIGKQDAVDARNIYNESTQ